MMELGAFSVSLAVKDIGASKDFYEKFGFTAFGFPTRWPATKPAGGATARTEEDTFHSYQHASRVPPGERHVVVIAYHCFVAADRTYPPAPHLS
jgi:catechol 2,3-dioxygenase-like lactoylglutathione lyase family enzyme